MRSDKRDTVEANAGADFTSPSFILQNLRLANEGLHSDKTSTILSRDFLSKSACLQICFYLFLALKSFSRQPTILLFGAGHTGTLLVEYLVEFKLGHCLRIFQRGDNATKQWRDENLASGCSLTSLLGGSKADIVIMCSGMSSFASICHSLIPFVSKATFFISACFGLSRRRIYSSLKTANIFRTFQETRAASQHSILKSVRRSLRDDARRIHGGDHDTAGEATFNTEGVTGPELQAYSADLLAKRCRRLENMVFLLENYYALRGMNHVTARTESVHNIFGKIAESFMQHPTLQGEKVSAEILSESSVAPPQHLLSDKATSPEGALDAVDITVEHCESSTTSAASSKSDNWCQDRDRDSDRSKLSTALALLQDGLVSQFQLQLSKSISVTDIPLASDIDIDINSHRLTTEPMEDGYRLQLLNFNDDEDRRPSSCSNSLVADATDAGEGDTTASPSPSTPLAVELLVDVDSKVEDLLCFSTTVPSQYDANKRDLETLRFQTKAKILRSLDLAPKMIEPLGVPMHSDSFLLRICEDNRFHGSESSSKSRDEEGLKGTESDDLDSKRSAALLELLAEIDAEESHQPKR